MPAASTNPWKTNLSRRAAQDPAAWIRQGWDWLGGSDWGKRLYSSLLGRAIPYTGSIGARVLELAPGHARVSLEQRRAVQNHLGSVHAIALANLAELTGNLALAYSLPKGARFIVTQISINYTKKARGTIYGECTCEPPKTAERREYTLSVALSDEGGDVVAAAELRTLVGPVKRSHA